MKVSHDTLFYVVSAVAIIAIITASYFGVTSRNQAQEIATNIQTIKQKDAALSSASSSIASLRRELTDIKNQLEELADDYQDERNRNEEFEDQIRNLAGTLGDLDKLANTDKELLAKYSKVYFLNENYIPERLKQIDDRYMLDGKGDQYFHASLMTHLEDMLDDARHDGVELKIISAYRSFETQSDLKGQYTQVYGSGANAFSADQGYSEHQLGTTIDLTTTDIGGTYTSFADTEAYKWLLDNAYKYGFVLSYPENNEFYIYEPWHWRFVSTDLARYLHKHDATFYEMEQRDINEYLLNFFD